MFVKLFDSTSDSLMSLLNRIRECKIQLPDFQRGWVWDDERIRKLLTRISLSYPIGAVMMLDAGNPDANFLTRPIEGVVNTANVKPDVLLLDGQQRLTSLFQSLILRDAVKTRDIKNNEIERFYYADINSMIDPNADQEEAIISVPGTRIIKKLGNLVVADYSDRAKECENDVFPINLFFDSSEAYAWQLTYTQNGSNVEKMQKWLKFNEYLIKFQQYQVPVISLSKHNTKEAVCSVFENVNTGGMPLTVFELLTAIYAADGKVLLRKDWEQKELYLKDTTQMHSKVLSDISSVEMLQAISLLATFHNKKAVSCKRKDILTLHYTDYQRWSEKVKEAFKDAAIFLQEQAVFSSRDLPYGSQLVPLAAIFVQLGNDAKLKANRQKIAQWYWCGVFGELYGGANETRFAKDYIEVVAWIRTPGAAMPSTILDSNFSVSRFLTLKTRNSAAYKGVYIQMMKSGACDFNSGLPIDLHGFYNMGIDIHHIFPKAYCEKSGIDKGRMDSIVNKAPLSYETNRSIGGRKPSEYLGTLDKRNSVSTVDNLLISQCIDPVALRSDDFNEFYNKRQGKLVELIAAATGKTVNP